ncbi:MAG TPA: sigma-70 family RNA polymerase sigma factor [Polyangiaceae bacterium]|nr:sigma-70 family RNA polymerase sigma factor [Polyangiaceae bacterium]
MTRSCEDWLSELGGSGPARDRAADDLRDFLKRSLARAFTGKLSDQDLDDLTQESVLRIHERLGSFERRSRFTTWATAIAVNIAYSALRQRRHRHVSLEDAMEAGAAALSHELPEHAELDREALLRDGIRRALTDRQRDAMLAFLGGLPLAEIARRTSVKQGAVYKLLYDARQRLKDYVETHGEGALGAGSIGVTA